MPNVASETRTFKRVSDAAAEKQVYADEATGEQIGWKADPKTPWSWLVYGNAELAVDVLEAWIEESTSLLMAGINGKEYEDELAEICI